MIDRRRHRWQLAALAVGLLSATLLVLPPSFQPLEAEDAPFVTGSGAASATVTKARIFYAGFSLVVPLGLSATSYENRQSRALGSAFDLTGVTSLADANQPQTSPISIDSNSGDAAKATDLGAGPVLGRVELTARDVPAATAEARLADVDLPGLLRVEGGHSKAATRVVDGKERVAEAEVTIGSVSLLDGLVTLDGLRWTAVQHTGAKERAEGSFTLASISVAGIPIAVDLHDLRPVIDGVNALLAPVGLVITSPEVLVRDDGAVEVTALGIGLVNSPLGAEVLGPVLAGVRPLLVPALDALVTANSTLGLVGLLGDLGLGVADGSGGIELNVGGATGSTDDAIFANPLGGGGNGPTLVSPTPTGSTGGVGLPAPAIPGAPTPGATQILPTAAGGPARCVLVASPRRHGDCRGTNVAGAIGVVALVVAWMAVWETSARRRRASALAVGGAS